MFVFILCLTVEPTLTQKYQGVYCNHYDDGNDNVINLGFIRKTYRTTLHLRQSFWNISATLHDYNLKFSNVLESLHSNKMCIRFRIDLLSRAFSNQCVFDENARRISVDRKADTHRNVRAFCGRGQLRCG